MTRSFAIIASIHGHTFDLATDSEVAARTTAITLSQMYGHPRVEVWHGPSMLGAYRGGERLPCGMGFAAAPVPCGAKATSVFSQHA